MKPKQAPITWGVLFTKEALPIAELLKADVVTEVTLKPGQYPINGDVVMLKSTEGKTPFKVIRRQYDFSESLGTVIYIALDLHDDHDYPKIDQV